MGRKTFACASVAATLLGNGASFGAQQFGTADEARAMLERGIAALKADESSALKAFNDEKDKQFRDRDLFVFCFSIANGTFTAYQSPALLGADVRELKLQTDPVGQRAYDAAHDASDGSIVSIEYNFPKAGSKGPVPKVSLETRVGDEGCGVSYYK